MTSAKLAQAFENGEIAINITGDFEFPINDWIPEEVGTWLDNNANVVARRYRKTTTVRQYLAGIRGRWSYLFCHPDDHMVDGCDIEFFRGNWGFPMPKIVSLEEFWGMIQDSNPVKDQIDIDEVFAQEVS